MRTLLPVLCAVAACHGPCASSPGAPAAGGAAPSKPAAPAKAAPPAAPAKAAPPAASTAVADLLELGKRRKAELEAQYPEHPAFVRGPCTPLGDAAIKALSARVNAWIARTHPAEHPDAQDEADGNAYADTIAPACDDRAGVIVEV